jgi:hypothetical protein
VGTLLDWLDLPGFYALLVLALLCLPMFMRQQRRRDRPAAPPSRKHRAPWRRP